MKSYISALIGEQRIDAELVRIRRADAKARRAEAREFCEMLRSLEAKAEQERQRIRREERERAEQESRSRIDAQISAAVEKRRVAEEAERATAIQTLSDNEMRKITDQALMAHLNATITEAK